MANKLYRIIGQVFDVDILTISDESNPGTIESWDSMNMYVLIDEIETEFNIKLSLDEILEINSVGNIKNLLTKYGCELNE